MGRKDYCSSLLWVPSAKSLSKLQRVQNAAVRLVTGSSRFSHITPVMYSLNWLPLKEWFHHKKIILTLTLFKWPTAFLSLWSLTIQHPSVYSLSRNDFSSQSAERSEFIICELQTRSSHLYLYISNGVRHDVIQIGRAHVWTPVTS